MVMGKAWKCTFGNVEVGNYLTIVGARDQEMGKWGRPTNITV